MANAPQGAPGKSAGEANRSRALPRDKTLHFRLEKHTAEALEAAAAADQRSVSAWVAICVTDRLREKGRIT
jgi:hypothetical protein